MVKRWKPAAALLLTFVLAVSLDQAFFLFLLGFEVMVYIAAWAQVLWLARHISMRVCIPQRTVFRGEKFQIQLELTNTSRLPVPQLMARAAVRVYPEREELLLRGKLMLGGAEKGRLCFELDSGHCVCLEIRANQLMITDYLGLVQKKCRVDEQEKLMLFALPDNIRQGADMPNGQSTLPGDDGENERAGHTAVDVAEIRPYQPGDLMKLVHWKLSARLEELMVREMSDPTDPTLRIYLDLCEPEPRINTRLDKEKWDHWMETVAGVSAALLAAERRHVMVWPDADGHRLQSRLVNDEDSQRLLLCELLRARTYTDEAYHNLFAEMNAGEAEEAWIEIDLQGRIDRSAAP